MSIFDKRDYSKIKDELLNNTISKINYYLTYNKFINIKVNYNAQYYPLKWLINKFVVEILEELDYDFYFKEILLENKIEFLELYGNSMIFFNSYLYHHNFRINENLMDEIRGIENSIFRINTVNNIDLIKKNVNYKNKSIGFYKFINKDIKRLVDNLNQKDWRDQISKFFSEKKIIEREKILNWFNGHIEREIKDQINNNFFNKQRIDELIGDLNNLYKHFGKTKNNNERQKRKYQDYEKLSEEEKYKKTEEDMHLILYILIEYENKIIH